MVRITAFNVATLEPYRCVSSCSAVLRTGLLSFARFSNESMDEGSSMPAPARAAAPKAMAAAGPAAAPASSKPASTGMKPEEKEARAWQR